MLTRVAVIAVTLAFLVNAARQGAEHNCGTPLAEAMTILFLLAAGPALTRAIVRAYKWHPPQPTADPSRRAGG
jgi:hypothetical protein